MYGFTVATLYLIVGGLVILLGIVILREAPREKANRATALMLSFGGLGSVLGAIGFILEGAGAAARTGSTDLLRSFNYLWELFFPSLLYFACVFPSENRLVRRVPFAALWIFAPHAFHLAIMVVQTQAALTGRLTAWLARNTIGATVMHIARVPTELTLGFHVILFSAVNLLYIVAALTLLWLSYRRATHARIRVQLRTIFIGLASCAGLYAIAVPIPTLFNQTWPPLTRSTLIVAALVLGSAGIAYSMVRYRFLDAKLLARKSILYALTSAFLVSVYLTIIRQLDAYLETVAGFDVTVFETAILLIALVLFQPVVSWLEEALEHVFLREKSDHRTLLRHMSGEVLTVLDLKVLADMVLETLREGVAARTTVLLIAPSAHEPVVRGFGGGVDLGAIASIPRAGLDQLTLGTPILRREELRDLVSGEGVAAMKPLLDTGPYLLLPLRHAGQFLGLISLGRKITETRYTAEEVSLIQTLANQTSVALKNALLYEENLAKSLLEEELAVARRIQQQFLPTRLPEMGRFGIAAINLPNKQVGGDYYDIVDLGSDNYLVTIADVAGKGVPAALLASMVQASVRTQAQDGKPVREMMDRLNRLVYDATPDDRFATCFLARVSTEGLSLSFSNAGHNYPILLPASGEGRLLDFGGIPLGIRPEFVYAETSTPLRPGDALILYTDGITDARNRLMQDYGEERLFQFAAELPRDLTARQLLEAISTDLSRFTEGAEQADDITLVALKVL
ncbi:MAG: GAF domain-containing protein [Candidatus Eisenbacteria bacterium]|uniref:GAF domain-containing protein n=1 Tax=Eiseniibacteriota bacterium TaxID=2212470 RepID=A0A538T4V5_UNCEI|nr:MAG: GAF domain-containing protein [Candidatus Eisenbacteria bacterium]